MICLHELQEVMLEVWKKLQFCDVWPGSSPLPHLPPVLLTLVLWREKRQFSLTPSTLSVKKLNKTDCWLMYFPPIFCLSLTDLVLLLGEGFTLSC